MTGATRYHAWVAGGLLLAAVPYAAGVVLLTRNAAAGELDGYTYWREPLLSAMTFAVVGALIGVRRPGNRVGVLLAAIGVLTAVQLLSGEYQAYVAHTPAGLPAGEQAGRLAEAAEIGSLAGYLLLLQIFPDGRLLGRWWRLVAACTVIALAFGLLGTWVDHVDVSAAVSFGVLVIIYGGIFPVALLGSFAVPVVRWRRGDGRLRAQMKWVAFAAVSALVLTLSGVLGAWSDPVSALLVPVATVVAILRYRLYDIDRLISRTFSYAVLTGLLVGVYGLLVTGVTRLLPVGSSQAVAVATLAVAALFQPLRRRLQSTVDRRFNRARFDATRTVEEFTARLREEVDLDAVRHDLIAVVHDTLQPASSGLWLRPGRES